MYNTVSLDADYSRSSQSLSPAATDDTYSQLPLDPTLSSYSTPYPHAPYTSSLYSAVIPPSYPATSLSADWNWRQQLQEQSHRIVITAAGAPSMAIPYNTDSSLLSTAASTNVSPLVMPATVRHRVSVSRSRTGEYLYFVLSLALFPFSDFFLSSIYELFSHL